MSWRGWASAPPCRLLALLLLPAWVVGGAPTEAQGFSLGTRPVVTGLARPLGVTHAGDGSGRLFLLLQGGQVLIHDGARLLPTPFLSIPVSCCGERGLLGLAFHPQYADNGQFFVSYTDAEGDSVVSRFLVSTSNPDVAEVASEVRLLTVPQPEANHNGGHIAFGPDGYLYVALGDGGGGGDQHGTIGNGQDLGTLLGKILRLDIDAVGVPYRVPPSNPFVGQPGARPEIWAYGLRNPWRFSFDRKTGDLWIADVGQGSWEEVNFQRAGFAGGANYGWRRREGAHCFQPAANCSQPGMVDPVAEYSHALGCSVTGGYRYRGPNPILRGVYFYGDFCTGRMWALTARCGGGWRSTPLSNLPFGISSFGEDEAGNLYAVAYDANFGSIQLLTGTAVTPQAGGDPRRGDCVDDAFRFGPRR